MLTCRTLSISIDKPYNDVYDFMHRPQNFALWAAGLTSGLHPRPNGVWVAETPLGHLEVQFSPPNGYGVLDHTVYLPTGPVYVPLRVIPNGIGAEVMLTLFRSNNMSDEIYADDIKTVWDDLSRLKALMEDGRESVVHVDFNKQRK